MIKRGMGHIEVILAFVLFVGFLLFGLYFFNPLNNNRLIDSSLFYAMDEITKNTSSELLTYAVVINSSVASDAVALQLDRNGIEGSGVRVEKSDGESLNSRYENNNLVFERQGNFFFVFFGDFPYNNSVVSGSPAVLSAPSNFSISSSDTRKVLSERGAIYLKEKYSGNYEGLKTQFNLPRRVDFSFSLKLGNESISASQNIPEGIEVFSDSKRVEVIRTDGTRTFADIIVAVW